MRSPTRVVYTCDRCGAEAAINTDTRAAEHIMPPGWQNWLSVESPIAAQDLCGDCCDDMVDFLNNDPVARRAAGVAM